MMKLDWANVKSAIVYGLLTAIVLGILAMIGYILKIGNIFGIEWREMINQGVIAGLAGLVMGISIIKNLLTTNKGDFIGVIEVIPDKTKN